MVRIAGAVLAGYIAMGVLATLTGRILVVVIPSFRTMTTVPMSYYVASTVTNTLYSIIGGYICAAVASASAGRATLVLMILGGVASVVAAVWFWVYLPLWFTFAMVGVLPLGVWIGSRLRQRRNLWSTQP
jgi:hypothetical protein